MRDLFLHVVLDTPRDEWPSDENLHRSVAGRLEGERLWDAYKPTEVIATQCTVVEGDVILTLEEADAVRCFVMGDGFDPALIDSVIEKIESAEEKQRAEDT